MDKTMIITGMKIDNFKKIEFVDQELDPKLNIVSGNNESGKTSLIEAMILAIEGKSAMGKNPERLIRTGSDKSIIEVSLVNDNGKTMTIERTITTKGVYLKAFYDDGTSVTQTDLNLIMDSSTINMMGLLHMKPAAQIDFMKEVGGIDTSAVEGEYKDKYSDRRGLNRTLADAQTLVKSLGDVPEVEPVDIQASLDKIDEIDKHNKQMESIQREIKTMTDSEEVCNNKVSSHEAAIENANKIIADSKRSIVENKKEAKVIAKKIVAKRKGLKARIDTAPIREEMREADTINKEAAKYSRYIEAIETEKKAEDKVNVVQIEMDALMERREKIISESKLPFSNIKFNKDLGVLVDDVALDDMSTAQKIKIMAKIYMKSNPSLKVIYIQDGSLLDKDTLAEIVEMSELKDFQFLIEIVGEEENSIIMREGAVVGAEKKEEKENGDTEEEGEKL